MSLFLKIFLWFWLAMALVVGAVVIVNWSTQSGPFVRQWRTFVGEAINVNSQTAVQIYENEGVKGLGTYVDRLKSRKRINAVGFFDEDKELVAGDLSLDETGDLFARTLASDAPQFLRLTGKTFAAKRVRLGDGTLHIYILELKRFRPPVFLTSRLLLQILAVVLTAGFVCYALARYLASPITELRMATQSIAEGNLKTRVAEKIRNRNDDLAFLAADFDEMAKRIESLIDSEKRLTQDVSHELRSPLARINVALELAKAKAGPEILPLIQRLENESARLNDLISQLLTLSRLETGSLELEKTEIDLKQLLEAIISDASFEAGARDRTVRAISLDDAKVFGNEDLLRRAIENVLRNAITYTRANTAVEVSAAAEGGEAVITIRDHGKGVPEEELARLFKPFYRIERARDRKSGGTGLGLAIAEHAVQHHKGRIGAENTGDGLLVRIYLPLAAKRAK